MTHAEDLARVERLRKAWAAAEKAQRELDEMRRPVKDPDVEAYRKSLERADEEE